MINYLKNSQRTILVALLLLAFVSQSIAQEREWVDASGRFKTIAGLIEVKENKVVLQKSSGAPMEVPLAKLSKQDRVYMTCLAKLGRNYDAANLAIPEHAVQFILCCESQRDPELARRRKRLASLRESQRRARSARNPSATEFSTRIKKQNQRIRAIDNALIFLPEISLEGTPGAKSKTLNFPPGFQVGQIGCLDRGFEYRPRLSDSGDVFVTALRFERRFGRVEIKGKELKPRKGFDRAGVINEGVSAPYASFTIQGLTTDHLQNADKQVQKESLVKLLTKHVYIVAQENDRRDKTTKGDFVLRPFDIRPINDWLKTKLKCSSSQFSRLL